jgi:trehalose-6-phosphate synthase
LPPAAPCLVVASNRLPVVLSTDCNGDWSLERGSGGLVTALEPVLRERGGVWIGWPGVDKSHSCPNWS